MTSWLTAASSAFAMDYVAVSVKIIDNPAPPASGQFLTLQQIDDAFADANMILDINGAGWRLIHCETVTIGDPAVTQFLDVCVSSRTIPTASEFDLAAKRDPVLFGWRYDAINVYVVNSICNGATLTAGFGLYPISEANPLGGDIVLLANDNNSPNVLGGPLLLHEIGHHLSLSHTSTPAAFHGDIELCPPFGNAPAVVCACSFDQTTNVMLGGLTKPVIEITLEQCQIDNMNFELGIDTHPDITASRASALRPTNNCALQDLGWQRGDCDRSGSISLSDVIELLNYVNGTGSGAVLACSSACDANDDGVVDSLDPVFLLNAIVGLATIPAPFPGCGPDPTTDALGCSSYLSC